MKLFLILGLAMLFIVGPVLMLRPSPRERRLARIRLAAQQRRVKVTPIFIRKDAVYGAVLERNPHLDGYSWSRYQLVGEENQTGPSIKGKWIQRKTPQGRLVWEPQDVLQKSVPAIDAVLGQWEQQQQVDFLALELGPRSASIVWNESGEAEAAEALCQQLEQLLAV